MCCWVDKGVLFRLWIWGLCCLFCLISSLIYTNTALEKCLSLIPLLGKRKRALFWELEKWSKMLCLDCGIPNSFILALLQRVACPVCVWLRIAFTPPAVANNSGTTPGKSSCENYMVHLQLFWSYCGQPKMESQALNAWNGWSLGRASRILQAWWKKTFRLWIFSSLSVGILL